MPLMRSGCEKHLAIITYIRSLVRGIDTDIDKNTRTLTHLWAVRCVTWIMWFLWHSVYFVRCCHSSAAIAAAVMLNWIKGCDGILYLLFNNRKHFCLSPFLNTAHTAKLQISLILPDCVRSVLCVNSDENAIDSSCALPKMPSLSPDSRFIFGLFAYCVSMGW